MLAVTQCLHTLHITAKVNTQRAPNPHVNLHINRTFAECLQNRRTITDDASIEISCDGQPDNSMAEIPVSNIYAVENTIEQADSTQRMHYHSTGRQLGRHWFSELDNCSVTLLLNTHYYGCP